jgi:hypothetical protein
MKKRISTMIKVDHFYEGQSYFFLTVEGKNHAFNVSFYKNIKQVISEINKMFKFEIDQHQVSSDGKLASILMNDNSRFLIAGILGYEEYVEEERINLVRRIESAQPFLTLNRTKRLTGPKLKSRLGRISNRYAKKYFQIKTT